jgi:hypothetical protein
VQAGCALWERDLKAATDRALGEHAAHELAHLLLQSAAVPCKSTAASCAGSPSQQITPGGCPSGATVQAEKALAWTLLVEWHLSSGQPATALRIVLTALESARFLGAPHPGDVEADTLLVLAAATAVAAYAQASSSNAAGLDSSSINDAHLGADSSDASATWRAIFKAIEHEPAAQGGKKMGRDVQLMKHAERQASIQAASDNQSKITFAGLMEQHIKLPVGVQAALCMQHWPCMLLAHFLLAQCVSATAAAFYALLGAQWLLTMQDSSAISGHPRAVALFHQSASNSLLLPSWHHKPQDAALVFFAEGLQSSMQLGSCKPLLPLLTCLVRFQAPLPWMPSRRTNEGDIVCSLAYASQKLSTSSTKASEAPESEVSVPRSLCECLQSNERRHASCEDHPEEAIHRPAYGGVLEDALGHNVCDALKAVSQVAAQHENVLKSALELIPAMKRLQHAVHDFAFAAVCQPCMTASGFHQECQCSIKAKKASDQGISQSPETDAQAEGVGSALARAPNRQAASLWSSSAHMTEKEGGTLLTVKAEATLADTQGSRAQHFAACEAAALALVVLRWLLVRIAQQKQQCENGRQEERDLPDQCSHPYQVCNTSPAGLGKLQGMHDSVLLAAPILRGIMQAIFEASVHLPALQLLLQGTVKAPQNHLVPASCRALGHAAEGWLQGQPHKVPDLSCTVAISLPRCKNSFAANMLAFAAAVSSSDSVGTLAAAKKARSVYCSKQRLSSAEKDPSTASLGSVGRRDCEEPEAASLLESDVQNDKWNVLASATATSGARVPENELCMDTGGSLDKVAEQAVACAAGTRGGRAAVDVAAVAAKAIGSAVVLADSSWLSCDLIHTHTKDWPHGAPSAAVVRKLSCNLLTDPAAGPQRLLVLCEHWHSACSTNRADAASNKGDSWLDTSRRWEMKAVCCATKLLLAAQEVERASELHMEKHVPQNAWQAVPSPHQEGHHVPLKHSHMLGAETGSRQDEGAVFETVCRWLRELSTAGCGVVNEREIGKKLVSTSASKVHAGQLKGPAHLVGVARGAHTERPRADPLAAASWYQNAMRASVEQPQDPSLGRSAINSQQESIAPTAKRQRTTSCADQRVSPSAPAATFMPITSSHPEESKQAADFVRPPSSCSAACSSKGQGEFGARGGTAQEILKEHLGVALGCSAEFCDHRGLVETFKSFAEAAIDFACPESHLQALSGRNTFVGAICGVLQGTIAHSWGSQPYLQSTGGTWHWVLVLLTAICSSIVDACIKGEPQRLPVRVHALRELSSGSWPEGQVAEALASVRNSLVRSLVQMCCRQM